MSAHAALVVGAFDRERTAAIGPARHVRDPVGSGRPVRPRAAARYLRLGPTRRAGGRRGIGAVLAQATQGAITAVAVLQPYRDERAVGPTAQPALATVVRLGAQQCRALEVEALAAQIQAVPVQRGAFALAVGPKVSYRPW